MELIDAQTVRHAVCNVDIPEGVTEEQFYAVMNNVAGAVNKMSAATIPNCAECKHWDTASGLTARKCDKWGAYTKQFDYCSYGRCGEMRLIDLDAFREEYDLREHCEDCGRRNKKACDYPSYSARDFCGWLDDEPTIDAVPIKAISAWLAAYAAPPQYAIDEIAGTDPGRIVTADTLVKAWEYHWKSLMECGLIGEGADAEAEKGT